MLHAFKYEKSNVMTLCRERKNVKEFYSIALYPTLFDDFVLVCHCGKRACMKKGAREYFDTKREALLHSLSIMENKKKQGYRLSPSTPKA